jgi:gamma-glutamylcyclotransferase (GGCT)/AIG2-like uncharacterized protein YtfP
MDSFVHNNAIRFTCHTEKNPTMTTPTTPTTPVFVYGTLRSGEGNYSWALAGKTASETRATLTGAVMHDNGGFPFVTMLDATETNQVIGDLMYINPDDYFLVMNSLDGLEGYRGPGNPGNMYDRVLVTVTTEDGTEVEAYTYLVASDLYEYRVSRLPVIDSGDWLNRKSQALSATTALA